MNVFFCFPTSSPVLLALYGKNYDDNDGDDNEGSPVLLAPYVRSTSRPKKILRVRGEVMQQTKTHESHPDRLTAVKDQKSYTDES